jgi:hypothetical protein
MGAGGFQIALFSSCLKSSMEAITSFLLRGRATNSHSKVLKPISVHLRKTDKLL